MKWLKKFNIQKPRELAIGLFACGCFSAAGFQYSLIAGLITMGASSLVLDVWLDREKKP